MRMYKNASLLYLGPNLGSNHIPKTVITEQHRRKTEPHHCSSPSSWFSQQLLFHTYQGHQHLNNSPDKGKRYLLTKTISPKATLVSVFHPSITQISFFCLFYNCFPVFNFLQMPARARAGTVTLTFPYYIL